MSIDHFEREERWRKIPAPIRELSQHNPILYDVLQKYVGGLIVTYEEALSQSVIALTTNYDKLIKDYMDYKSMVVQPMIVTRS